MQRVHLAKGRSHLSALGNKARRQRCEGDEALFQVDSLLAKRDEEITPRIGIDDRLQSYFGFMHLEGWRGIDWVMTQARDEVSNHAHVRIQRFRSRTAGPAQPNGFRL